MDGSTYRTLLAEAGYELTARRFARPVYRRSVRFNQLDAVLCMDLHDALHIRSARLRELVGAARAEVLEI